MWRQKFLFNGRFGKRICGMVFYRCSSRVNTYKSSSLSWSSCSKAACPAATLPTRPPAASLQRRAGLPPAPSTWWRDESFTQRRPSLRKWVYLRIWQTCVRCCWVGGPVCFIAGVHLALRIKKIIPLKHKRKMITQLLQPFFCRCLLESVALEIFSIATLNTTNLAEKRRAEKQ